MKVVSTSVEITEYDILYLRKNDPSFFFCLGTADDGKRLLRVSKLVAAFIVILNPVSNTQL